MDRFAAQQLTMSAGDHPGLPEQPGRRCVLFGCVQTAAWIVSDPQGGELPACEVDLDLILNDALSRIPITAASGSRSGELWRTVEAGPQTTLSAYHSSQYDPAA